MYGMALEKTLPRFLSLIGSRKTPWAAIIVGSALSIVFVLFGKIGFVANLTDIFLFLTFASVNLALIILRYRESGHRRPFRCPLNIGRFPVVSLLGLLSSLALMVFAVTNLIGGVH